MLRLQELYFRQNGGGILVTKQKEKKQFELFHLIIKLYLLRKFYKLFTNYRRNIKLPAIPQGRALCPIKNRFCSNHFYF